MNQFRNVLFRRRDDIAILITTYHGRESVVELGDGIHHIGLAFLYSNCQGDQKEVLSNPQRVQNFFEVLQATHKRLVGRVPTCWNSKDMELFITVKISFQYSEIISFSSKHIPTDPDTSRRLRRVWLRARWAPATSNVLIQASFVGLSES